MKNPNSSWDNGANNWKTQNHGSSISRGFSKSSTKVTHVSPGVVESTTKSSSASAKVDLDGVLSLATGQQPKQQTRLAYCEMQIATNSAGVITAMNNTGDTPGVGLSLSRCAEILK
jgi:hypothetical protein